MNHASLQFEDEELPELPDILLGAIIDNRYRIERRVGQGGMGAVYEGEHVEMRRKVAVKVLMPIGGNAGRNAVERFLREARTAGNIGHPNVVDIYDLGRLDDGRPYLVMPFLHGFDLSRRLDAGIPFDPQQVAWVIRSAAAALDAVHAKGVIHRDVKPGNLFIARQADDTFLLKLLDFGLVSLSITNTADAKLTQTGLVNGTPHYMAPEAASGLTLDRRADVYALATVAFEMLTGKVPFDAPTPLSILSMKVNNPPPRLAELNDLGFSEEIESAIARGLAQAPDARFETAGKFAAALEAAAGGAIAFCSLESDGLEHPMVGDMEVLSWNSTESPLSVRPPAVKDDAASISLPTRTHGRFVIGALLVAAIAFVTWVVVDGDFREREDPIVPTIATNPPPAEQVEIEVPPAAAEDPTREPEAIEAEPTPIAPRERIAPPTPSAPLRQAEPPTSPPAAAEPSQTPLVLAEVGGESPAELTNRGTAKLVDGRIPEAIEDFRRATMIAPSFAAAWRNLGVANQRLGRSAEAIRAYQTYLQLQPNAPDAAAIRARLSALGAPTTPDTPPQ